jgi:hypothetical protein
VVTWFIAPRLNGDQIEVMVFRNDGSEPVLIPITVTKALDLAHQLTGHALSLHQVAARAGYAACGADVAGGD